MPSLKLSRQQHSRPHQAILECQYVRRTVTYMPPTATYATLQSSMNTLKQGGFKMHAVRNYVHCYNNTADQTRGSACSQDGQKCLCLRLCNHSNCNTYTVHSAEYFTHWAEHPAAEDITPLFCTIINNLLQRLWLSKCTTLHHCVRISTKNENSDAPWQQQVHDINRHLRTALFRCVHVTLCLFKFQGCTS